MRKLSVGFIALITALMMVPSVFAQEPFIYPDKGQSVEQQEKDKHECYSWAKGQTGFDPMQVPTTTVPPPDQQAQQGGAGRGAARGALTGAVIGEIADDDPGKGAAIGAASGALVGGMRRRDQQAQQQQEQQQWAQQETANYENQRNNYNRAYSACLEGRGYTVK